MKILMSSTGAGVNGINIRPVIPTTDDYTDPDGSDAKSVSFAAVTVSTILAMAFAF